ALSCTGTPSSHSCVLRRRGALRDLHSFPTRRSSDLQIICKFAPDHTYAFQHLTLSDTPGYGGNGHHWPLASVYIKFHYFEHRIPVRSPSSVFLCLLPLRILSFLHKRNGLTQVHIHFSTYRTSCTGRFVKPYGKMHS